MRKDGNVRPLTDADCKNAKPVKGKAQIKLADSGGLALVVKKSGSKVWWVRYRYDGREQTLTLGTYPTVSLAEAREGRDKAKRTLAAGRNPAVVKRLERVELVIASGTTFEDIARDWYEHNRERWRGKHVEDVISSLKKDVFPMIGNLPIADITPKMCLAVIRKIEERGVRETAHRVHQRMTAVFQYGVVADLCPTNPAKQIDTLLKHKRPVVSMPAVTDLAALRDMLRRVEAMPAHPVTLLANRFQAITFIRPDTLATTPWNEIDMIGDDFVWKIPGPRMKMAREFWIKLPPQAVEILTAIRPLTGRTPFVFPNARWHHQPMSNGAVLMLIKRAGYNGRHCGHGYRASFNTIMREKHKGDKTIKELIGKMLAHASDKDPYDRAEFLDQRGELLQEWADMLLAGFPPAADLIDGPRRSIAA